MTINGISGSNTQVRQMGMNEAADAYSRNIQNQIANAQKELQELSSNEDMSSEEKMKKRQEIQQQISDLNVQLRQHQAEQRREKQQAKGSSMDGMSGGTRGTGNVKAGSKSTGLSEASMTAIISAEGSIKQANAQGSAATKMEGRAGVLKSEMKLDQARGNDTGKKQEELAEAEQKAQTAESSQLSTLADASKTMEEAAKADSSKEVAKADGSKEAAKADGREEKADDKGAKIDDTDTKTDDMNAKTAGIKGKDSEVSASRSAATAETTTEQSMTYTSVDIRL